MLSIGELSRATDCKVETIRYYETVSYTHLTLPTKA